MYEAPVATKKELLLDLLQREWVYLQLDGRVDGVDLPDWLRGPTVTLQVGYDMPVPIVDLVIDDEGVKATLSFRRTPHACRIPWSSIYAFSDGEGRGLLFPESVPPELGRELAEMVQRANEGAGAAPATSPAEGPPTCPAEGPATAPAEERATASSAPPPPRLKSGKPRPSHLKLV